ncbi:hypothetical protein DTO164E3_8002 [Paecilomyces variotii]|nr:hypothetical protein DTO032I3_8092 [Paecilomyces variotii]KAJ9193178.1 hypothetical protein DTO164E3_8002 [Paecilomyces variotii]KAJ9274929.1 hypothetical protein DTO021D3_8197 [Paecilomyces variotii]KAJ9339403.1 hypothetical protein DTO027B6_8057 [Paecilomyces variotii]KAJ9348838.1 hypothetical protein DTO027B9_7981 [Paecilomyces variotii]
MFLGPVSYLDCCIFLVFLTPQLIIHAGLWTTLYHGARSLPFLAVQLPSQVIFQRYLLSKAQRAPFYRHATLFQEIVIRCVKYAFAEIPPQVGRVFFAREVVHPFLRYRMRRHGYLRPPVHYREVQRGKLNGIWIIANELEKPDIVIYYAHGGGFSMGTAYFYLEFLMTWVAVLRRSGYRNPAIFALEYTLVPDEVYPVQVQQAAAGYEFVMSMVEDPSHICVSGDSAGATVMLSLLLSRGRHDHWEAERPGLAAFFSPWLTLVSPDNRNTESDYLNMESLHLYALQYAGKQGSLEDPMVSPGTCKDTGWWRRSSPSGGFVCFYGSEEVFGPETRRWSQLMSTAGCRCEVVEQSDSIHVWPVVALFIGDTTTERLEGLIQMTDRIIPAIPPARDRMR